MRNNKTEEKVVRKKYSPQFKDLTLERISKEGDLAKQHVFEYIEIYYNRKRLHSMIDHKSPELFEVKKVA